MFRSFPDLRSDRSYSKVEDLNIFDIIIGRNTKLSGGTK